MAQNEQTRKIILRLPNWLGDCVMSLGAFEKLKAQYKDAKFIIVGSAGAQILARDERVQRVIIDNTKSAKSRILATLQLAKDCGVADLSFCFTNGFFGALFLFFTRSKIRVGFAKNLRSIFLTHAPKTPKHLENSESKAIHQAQKYEFLVKDFVDSEIFSTFSAPKLTTQKNAKFEKQAGKKYVGINPGAAFGSAKCWEKASFENLIKELVKRNFVVVIFGNEKLLDFAPDSENVIDLVNRTSISELIDAINDLDLFITNDSGPMHIASALGVKSVCIFGSTDTADTSPWSKEICERFFSVNGDFENLDSENSQSCAPSESSAKIENLNFVKTKNLAIIHKHLPCSPCKKRVCPLKHHNCMKQISVEEVLNAALKLLEN